jgi:twitching motility protein PilT
MAELIKYLKFAVENEASDILIVAGGPVSAKIDGHMRTADDERVLPPQAEDLIQQIYEMA